MDFWQADEYGDYDNVGFNFRGKIITDENGNYNLETIIPGKYLNGSQYRPSHIHLKVQAEDTMNWLLKFTSRVMSLFPQTLGQAHPQR